MPPSSSRHAPHSNRPTHHNRTTHTAFTATVRLTLDAPLPPTPPSPSLLSPNSSSSSSSSSSNSPRFRNSAPLPRRGDARPRPSTPNAYSAPLTPPSPYGNSSSPNTSSPATSLLEDEARREYVPPSRAFADARESPPSYPRHPTRSSSLHTKEEVTIRPSPAHNIAASSRKPPSFLLPGQAAHVRRAVSAAPNPLPPTNQLFPSLPPSLEELYIDLGIIHALPSLSPRDHLASIEMMNDDIAVWAATNPVAGMHVLAIAEKLRVGRRFEGTLGLGSGEVEDWMGRRGLVRRGGNAEGTSFKERMRQLRDEAAGVEKKKERGEAVKKGVQRGEHGWRELPLVVVLLYSEVCGVDLTRMGDREGRAMLADWAGRYWPVSDEGMLEVMMEWGGERNGKVDIDPRKWRGEDEGKVERVIERTRGLGAEEVRRGGTLVGRLAGGVGRSGSVRTSKK